MVRRLSGTSEDMRVWRLFLVDKRFAGFSGPWAVREQGMESRFHTLFHASFRTPLR